MWPLIFRNQLFFLGEGLNVKPFVEEGLRKLNVLTDKTESLSSWGNIEVNLRFCLTGFRL